MIWKSCFRWINCTCVLVGFVPFSVQAVETEVLKKLEVLAKVLSYVETNYIEDVNPSELLDNSIKGLLSSLDPHTLYMPPAVYREMKDDTTGEFGGVGIEISVKDALLTVIAPIDGSPAQRAGVKAGDTIVEIEGMSAQELGLAEAVKKIRGKLGTVLKLTLKRKDSQEQYKVALKRQRIEIKSISSKLVDQFYGYVQIKNFQEKSDRELQKAITKLQKDSGISGLRGLILDLRNNPGGLLDQAVRIADQFLESGVIVSTIGKKGAFQEVKMAHEADTYPNFPMITLVNEGTASASEVLAGALQDHRRSVILGTQTFGKGSVQTVIDLEDGSGLKLTVAKYYTPEKRSIQALGITPDIYVSQVVPPEVVSYVREKDLAGHIQSSETSSSSVKNVGENEDIQYTRALEYLKMWEVFQNTVLSKKNHENLIEVPKNLL